MTVTILGDSGYTGNFVFYKNTHEIKITNPAFPLYQPSISSQLQNNNNLNFISDKNKIFVTLSSNYYHFHNDSVASLLNQYQKIENCMIVIDISLFDNKTNYTFYTFFLKTLDDLKIEYVLINCNLDTIIHANNFYIMFAPPTGLMNSADIVFNFYKRYINDLSKPSYRKVYLDRKNNTRLLNNFQLQKYLSNNNFEIIFAEDFSDFKEQINYFYTVKTLISVTGSGLTNAMFMQENSNIIELSTPFSIVHPKLNNKITTELHHFYNLISFFKNQQYVSIPNITNNSDTIINKLDNVIGSINE
jgi:capsular polysaccharide biosynthesis protein